MYGQTLCPFDFEYCDSGSGDFAGLPAWSKASEIFHALCDRMDHSHDCQSAGTLSGKPGKNSAETQFRADRGGCAGPDYRIKLFSRLQTDSAGSGAGKDLPVLYDALSADLQEISVRFASLFSRLPEQVQTNWQELAGSISHAASLVVQKIASPTVEVAGNVAKGIPNALVNVIVTILSSYFFIAEQDKIVEFWKTFAGECQRLWSLSEK